MQNGKYYATLSSQGKQNNKKPYNDLMEDFTMKKWVCKVCGYIYEGPEAPAECPVCHAKSNMFEEVKGEM